MAPEEIARLEAATVRYGDLVVLRDAFVLSAGVALGTALLLAFVGDASHHHATFLAGWTLALLVAAALLGSAIGAFLHRPVLRSVAWSVTLAVLGFIAVALLPPIQDVLRAFNDDRTGGVVVLLLCTLVLATAATAASALLADRRSA